MPLISIIMSSYNHEKFISIAIESVLNQTINNLELIIVDDSSKDNSRRIIQNYSKKDSRIKILFHEKNKGIAKTLNDGLEIAKGKFISFIASDDVWSRDKLEKQVEILKKNENLIVWSEGKIIDADGNPTGKLFTHMHDASKKKKSGNIFKELIQANFIFGSSLIFKRENAKSFIFNTALKYLNDYQFVVDLARRYEYFFIPEPLAMYRIHGGNTILLDKEGWQIDQIIINDYFLNKYSDEISKSVKSKICLRSGIIFSSMGKKSKAMQYVYNAIKANPFNPDYFFYLFFISTNKNGFIHNFLRKGYKCYEKLIQKN